MRAPAAFTVVMAALDDYAVIREVHRCLEAQSIRDRLEILFVCRDRKRLRLPEGFDADYPDVRVIEGGPDILLNEARALGVREASTPYVLILEDHCLPHADCLEHMLARLQEGWSAVGPGFVSGNTDSRLAIAANLLTYGEWMGWTEGGERRFVSGYNSALATDLLLARGARLDEDLVTPSTLQMQLHDEGHRFYFEPRAVMSHWESSGYRGVTKILLKNGRGLGALRARHWSAGRKLLASLLNPALAGYRFLRAAKTWARVGGCGGRALVHLLPLTLLWTFGELRGYWSSDFGEAVEGVSDIERNRQRFVDARKEPIRKPY